MNQEPIAGLQALLCFARKRAKHKPFRGKMLACPEALQLTSWRSRWVATPFGHARGPHFLTLNKPCPDRNGCLWNYLQPISTCLCTTQASNTRRALVTHSGAFGTYPFGRAKHGRRTAAVAPTAQDILNPSTPGEESEGEEPPLDEAFAGMGSFSLAGVYFEEPLP